MSSLGLPVQRRLPVLVGEDEISENHGLVEQSGHQDE